MLLSLIAFMNYLYRGRHLYDLMLAALAAGLAWLTKSPALFLIPFFSLLSIIEFARLWWKERRFSFQDVWNVAWPFMVWVGIAALVFVLLWPAMWVNPIGTIQMIFTEASDYAEEGHHSATFFNGQIYPAGTSDWLFYPINYLWRTTPTILIGLLLAALAIIFRQRFSTSKQHQQAILALSLFAVLFSIFMTFGSKKFDRYLLPAFAPLALVAALGWFIIVNRALKFFASFWVSGSKAGKVIQIGGAFLLILILLTQMIGPLQTFPYYFSYYNPIMGGSRKAPEVMMIGYGEGLDQAARYLNAKPDAAELRVLSWYPDGPFSYIFNGRTLYQGFASNPENLINADYYVLYYHQWQRQLPSKELIQYFDHLVPEHIVYIDGLEYVRLYHRDTLQSQSLTE
jgi:hypothetical protein